MVRVQISRDGLTPFHFSVSAADLELNSEVDENNFEDDVEIEGEIISNGGLFKVSGTIKCRKSFTCDRCLTLSTEEQVHDFDEELNAGDIEDNVADLTELIRDTLIASQPIKNLCKVDCKGLCPICGMNLNEGDCNCDRFIVDPRLEALKDFLGK